MPSGRRSTTDGETRDRLDGLADRLRSQAERDTTPAVGAPDRIQHALGDVAPGADGR